MKTIENKEYIQFLKTKKHKFDSVGKKVNSSKVNPILFPFQKDVVVWAVNKGRCAIFLDTGLGKTFIQLEWARLLEVKTLIVAPLSVAKQTVQEAKKIGIEVVYCRNHHDATGIINITNYEMLDSFHADEFDAIVLDESSILKSLDGATRNKLIEMFENTKYKLACTATPAPNDQVEIGNHAEFLGICTMPEMLAMFFVNANKVREVYIGNNQVVKQKQSGRDGQEWRLRNHAVDKFYEWMSSWSISLQKPSDLGYEDDGYILPKLTVNPLFVKVDYVPDGQLFFTELKGIQDRTKIRHVTLSKRIDAIVSMVNNSKDQWIIWCGLNDEANAIEKALTNSVQVQGSDNIEKKINSIELFQAKKIKVLITKPKIAGHGMNFQNCHNMIFMGMSDSFESYYQCVRRVYRFGQKHPVNVYIVLGDIEQEIYNNVMRKEKVAKRMREELILKVKKYEKEEIKMDDSVNHFSYNEKTVVGENFTAMLGDSSQRLSEIADNSIDMSVYSPPFADLFTYSASELDLGNSKDWSEFFKHYKFIIDEILRVTKSGRLTCVHTADIPAMQGRDGYIGMRDFPGAVIKAYEESGWIFFGRAIVAKNPQAQAIRTKAKGLLFVQLNKDSSDSRPAILDQILIFKKTGDTEVPITPVVNGEMDNEKWIDWAGGIWLGINESDTLQFTTARAAEDEKHICPLQLGTIERCIKLYSNPGETILTPFLGIGSEAYQALRFGRKAIGIELKESYFNVAVKNLKEVDVVHPDLFSAMNTSGKVKK